MERSNHIPPIDDPISSYQNKIWVTVVYRLINNGLELWCV